MPDSLRTPTPVPYPLASPPHQRLSRPTALQLMAQEAAISKAAAREIAQRAASGRVVFTELCRAVDGRLLYVVLIAAPGRAAKRAILVDAQSGAVVADGA